MTPPMPPSSRRSVPAAPAGKDRGMVEDFEKGDKVEWSSHGSTAVHKPPALRRKS